MFRGAVLYWQRGEALAAEQRRAENLAHLIAENVDRTFGAIGSALNQLAAHSGHIGGPRAAPEIWSPVLTATLSGLSAIGSLNVVDADGVVTLSTNPAVTGTARTGRFLDRRLRESGRRLIHNLLAFSRKQPLALPPERREILTVAEDDNPYEACNRRQLEFARQLADDVTLIALSDGTADGAGGTQDLVQRTREAGGAVEVIDVKKLRG